MKKTLVKFILVATLLPISSCLDPKAVTDFATAALETIDLIDEYGKDMEESCRRIALVQDAESNCDSVSVYPSTMKIEAILTAYVINLHRLSDNDRATFSEDFDALEGEIGNLEKFDEDKVKGVRGLCELMTEAAASGYRRKELQSVIPKADPDFTKIITAVSDFANVFYREHLILEKTAIEMRRESIKADFETKEKLAFQTADAQLKLMLTEVIEKIAGIDKFVKALEVLAKAHRTLSDNASTIDASVVLEQIKSYSSEIQKLNKEIKAAF